MHAKRANVFRIYRGLAGGAALQFISSYVLELQIHLLAANQLGHGVMWYCDVRYYLLILEVSD